MTNYKTIDVEIEKNVAVITLTNPPRQLMNLIMVQELMRVTDELEKNDEVRAIIITGGVPGIFITHYDVGELETLGKIMKGQHKKNAGNSHKKQPLHPTHIVFNRLEAMPKPVIAAINGTAMGGGCELTLACDLRYMADTGVIGLPESTVGILPWAGGTQRLPRLIGASKALELILLGQVVTPGQAEELGIVNKVLPADKLLSHCKMIARTLASRPAITMKNIKRCVYEGMELPLIDALHLEQNYFNELMNSDEALELMKKFNKEGGDLSKG